MDSICEKCVKENSCDGYKRWKDIYKEEVSGCTDFEKRKTNADKVRSMSDDELAKLLGGLSARAYDWVDSTEEETAKWLEWLRKEADK